MFADSGTGIGMNHYTLQHRGHRFSFCKLFSGASLLRAELIFAYLYVLFIENGDGLNWYYKCLLPPKFQKILFYAIVEC